MNFVFSKCKGNGIQRYSQPEVAQKAHSIIKIGLLYNSVRVQGAKATAYNGISRLKQRRKHTVLVKIGLLYNSVRVQGAKAKEYKSISSLKQRRNRPNYKAKGREGYTSLP